MAYSTKYRYSNMKLNVDCLEAVCVNLFNTHINSTDWISIFRDNMLYEGWIFQINNKFVKLVGADSEYPSVKKLEALSKYVMSGTYVELVNDDDQIYRIVYNNMSWKIVYPTIVWDY